MSRTKKDRGKQWRYVKNSLYKKNLHIWSEDFATRRKDKQLGRTLRKRLKRDLERYEVE